MAGRTKKAKTVAEVAGEPLGNKEYARKLKQLPVELVQLQQ